MSRKCPLQIIFPLFIAFAFSVPLLGQGFGSVPYRSQESDKEGVPVLIKHLPDWEKVHDRATIANTVGPIKAAIGPRPVLDLIDFSGGTEAVTSPYDAGRLLIVEYSSPQASIEADTAFRARLADAGEKTIYRRIGNYNAFVFNATDEAAANALLDQVKYEKQVQWLGKNPFLQKQAERAFVITTTDIFISTVLVILIGISFSLVGGVICGYLYFSFRERKRAAMSGFSDAGGLTRLNLDGLTPDMLPSRMLKD